MQLEAETIARNYHRQKDIILQPIPGLRLLPWCLVVVGLVNFSFTKHELRPILCVRAHHTFKFIAVRTHTHTHAIRNVTKVMTFCLSFSTHHSTQNFLIESANLECMSSWWLLMKHILRPNIAYGFLFQLLSWQKHQSYSSHLAKKCLLEFPISFNSNWFA